MSDGIGTSGAGGNGVGHIGSADEEDLSCGLDVDTAGARGGGGIGNDRGEEGTLSALDGRFDESGRTFLVGRLWHPTPFFRAVSDL